MNRRKNKKRKGRWRSYRKIAVMRRILRGHQKKELSMKMKGPWQR